MIDFIEKCLASTRITAALRFVGIILAGLCVLWICAAYKIDLTKLSPEMLFIVAAIALPALGIDISKIAVLQKYNMPQKLEQSQINEKKVEQAAEVLKQAESTVIVEAVKEQLDD